MNLQEEQANFRRVCGKQNNMYPIAPEQFEELMPEVALSQVLIQEEFRELMVALDACSEYKDDPSLYYSLLAEVCAEGVDLVYVVMDLFNVLGLPANAMFSEIHNANMAKAGPNGQVRKREDGKILKPKGWKPANKLGVVMSHRDYKV